MSDETQKLGQDEIEALLSGTARPASTDVPQDDAPPPGGALGQEEIEAMLSGGAQPTVEAAAPRGTAAAIEDADQNASQDEVQRPSDEAGPTPSATAARRSVHTTDDNASVQHKDIELLFSQAESALASVGSPSNVDAMSGIRPFQLDEFSGQRPSEEVATLDLIRDVELNVRIELGRTHMYLEDVLKLHKGSVVPLDKLAGDPVDIYVNGRLIARGEVLVLNDNFCVRVAELIAGENARAG
jgi:flagellar motor switch protein FliN/FliY